MKSKKLQVFYFFSFLSSILKVFFGVVPLIFTRLNPVFLLFCLVLIGFFDCMDGKFADWAEKKTVFRRLFDNFTDRVALNAYFFALYINYNLPFFIYLIFLIREILLILGGCFLITKARKVVYTNWLPKLVNISIGIAVICYYLIQNPFVWKISFTFAVLLMAIGIGFYAKILITSIRNDVK